MYYNEKKEGEIPKTDQYLTGEINHSLITIDFTELYYLG